MFPSPDPDRELAVPRLHKSTIGTCICIDALESSYSCHRVSLLDGGSWTRQRRPNRICRTMALSEREWGMLAYQEKDASLSIRWLHASQRLSARMSRRLFVCRYLIIYIKICDTQGHTSSGLPARYSCPVDLPELTGLQPSICTTPDNCLIVEGGIHTILPGARLNQSWPVLAAHSGLSSQST